MFKTPLNAWHIAHHANMVDFNGWHMPLYYKGITEEHHYSREAAGAFDLCHMGRVILRGAGVREFVDTLTPAHIRTAKTGDVLYSFLLDENGRTIDDITIYLAEDHVMLVVNAGGRQRDMIWLREQAVKHGAVQVEDVSESMAMIAVQGPKAPDLLCEFLASIPEPIPYYSFREMHTPNVPYPVLVSNTGYTGEKGYEIYSPAEHLVGLWTVLFGSSAEGILRPIGLGARDSLRLEAGMPLYGHELNDTTTPLEAGLGKFVDFEKPAFIGRDALMRQRDEKPARKLVGFEMLQRGPVARQGFEIEDASGRKIGTVTSGIFSPTLQKTIGMAYVAADASQIGSDINIEIRGRKMPARIVKRQFYKRRD